MAEAPVAIHTIAGGAIVELFDRELERVTNDILDLNAEAEAVRTITIKIKIKPDKERNFGMVEATVDSVMGKAKGVGSMMYFGKKGGRAVAMQNENQRELFDQAGPRPVINFNTGEVTNG